MKKLINLLLGYVELQVTGAFPERLLNLCAQNRLQFWKLCWLDETSFTFRISLRDRGRLEELARRAMCELDERGRRGAVVTAGRLVERRWGFVAGLALCFLAVSFLSRFLLVVEVTGNETVPAAVILSQLQRVGVRPGAYGPAIQEKEAANAALLGLPELSYLAINIYGTRAEVVVREAEKKPQVLEENVPTDIVSRTDGMIEDIHAEAGRALFQDGDIVAKGEVLITGELDLKEPEGSTVDLGRLVVHASGQVTARTWRILEETIPLSAQVKEYSGEEQTRHGIKILWFDLDFFENSSISGERYDKITKTWNLTLPGDLVLPLSLGREDYRAYETVEAPVDPAAAQAMLEERLLARLTQLLGDTGREVSHSFAAGEEDGCLKVTLTAECEEELGRFVPAG